jgi:hypothetical protein
VDYISQHSGENKRDPKDVIKKSIEIKKAGGVHQKGGSNQSFSAGSSNAVQQLCSMQQKVKTNYEIKDAPSVRYDFDNGEPSSAKVSASRERSGSNAPKVAPENTVSSADSWNGDEQSALEKALQAYPPSYKGADRWDLIAALVPGKSKKDCKLRVKVSCSVLGFAQKATNQRLILVSCRAGQVAQTQVTNLMCL